jgi:hypothetical protein
MPPGNLSSLIASESDLEGVGKAFDELKLTTSVDKLKGVTIFAPINEVSSRRQWYIWIEDWYIHGPFYCQALAKIPSAATTAAGTNETLHVFLNHLLNGTVIYSSQFPASEEDNKVGSSKVTNVTTAGGNLLTFAYGKDGKVEITCGNVTAKIVQADNLLSNGVAHYIDAVIVNPTFNATAAQKTAGTNQVTVPVATSTTEAAAGSKSGSSDGAISSLVQTNALVLVSFTLALAIFLTLV